MIKTFEEYVEEQNLTELLRNMLGGVSNLAQGVATGQMMRPGQSPMGNAIGQGAANVGQPQQGQPQQPPQGQPQQPPQPPQGQPQVQQGQPQQGAPSNWQNFVAQKRAQLGNAANATMGAVGKVGQGVMNLGRNAGAAAYSGAKQIAGNLMGQ